MLGDFELDVLHNVSVYSLASQIHDQVDKGGHFAQVYEALMLLVRKGYITAIWDIKHTQKHPKEFRFTVTAAGREQLRVYNERIGKCTRNRTTGNCGARRKGNDRRI